MKSPLIISGANKTPFITRLRAHLVCFNGFHVGLGYATRFLSWKEGIQPNYLRDRCEGPSVVKVHDFHLPSGNDFNVVKRSTWISEGQWRYRNWPTTWIYKANKAVIGCNEDVDCINYHATIHCVYIYIYATCRIYTYMICLHMLCLNVLELPANPNTHTHTPICTMYCCTSQSHQPWGQQKTWPIVAVHFFFRVKPVVKHRKKNNRLGIVIWLVVSTPLKNISQNGNLPQIGVKIKTVWNHHLVMDGELATSRRFFLPPFCVERNVYPFDADGSWARDVNQRRPCRKSNCQVLKCWSKMSGNI